jgi:hypothetical protein
MRRERGPDWYKKSAKEKGAKRKSVKRKPRLTLFAESYLEDKRARETSAWERGMEARDTRDMAEAVEALRERRARAAERDAEQAHRDARRGRQLAEAREADNRIGGGVWKDWPTRMEGHGSLSGSMDETYYKQVRSADVMGYGYNGAEDEMNWSECYFVVRSGKKYAITHGDSRLVYVAGLTKVQAIFWLRDEIAGKHEHDTYECDESYDTGPWSPDAEENYYTHYLDGARDANPRRRRHNHRRR